MLTGGVVPPQLPSALSPSVLPAPGPSYLVLLLIVHGEAALQPQREFLELDNDFGIGGVVFEAHGILHYVLHQEKCLLKVAHGIILESNNLEFMTWLMPLGSPGSVLDAPSQTDCPTTAPEERTIHSRRQRTRPSAGFHSPLLASDTTGDCLPY